jgi:hypothetical protein
VPSPGPIFSYNYSEILSVNIPCKPSGSTGVLYSVRLYTMYCIIYCDIYYNASVLLSMF